MSRPSMASRLHTTRRVTAVALTLLLPMQTTACLSVWHPVTTPIPTLTNARPTDRYRITLVNGEVVQIIRLSVRGDSVLGRSAPWRFVPGATETTSYPVGFPVSQVARVERHSVPAWNYLASSLGLFAGVMGIGVLGIAASGGIM
jgi:hypothetical protein